MAPRRVVVADALTNDDDTLANSIRQDVLGANADDQADDQQQDDGADDQADDQQQDDGADDQADDQQQDDGADDQQPEPRRRAARQERDDGRLSPEVEARIATAERIAAEAVERANTLAQQFGQPRETAEQEAARLATMTPEQIIDYKLGKALGQHNTTLRQVTFNAQNSADKVSFEGLVRDNPQLKRFAADVERKHAELVRGAAQTGAGVPTRDSVLKYMLGEKALELAQKAAPQGRERTRRVEQQRTRPGSARSDVSTTRRQQSTAEQRLDGVPL